MRTVPRDSYYTTREDHLHNGVSVVFRHVEREFWSESGMLRYSIHIVTNQW